MPAPVARAAEALQAAFRQGDFSPAVETLADDIVFHSPVLARPWRGRAVLARLGPAMVSVLEDVAFAPVIADGRRAILRCTARRGSIGLEAIQVLAVGDDGRVAELTMYIRPLPALIAVAKAMEARVDPDLLASQPVAKVTA